MTAWLLISAVTVALAELYSEVIGAETSERHRVTRHQLSHMLESAGAVALGVGFPAVFFLLALVHLIELDTAFAMAKWGGLGLIGFYGYWAARFAGAPVPRALLQAALVAAVGGIVIVFKALVHGATPDVGWRPAGGGYDAGALGGVVVVRRAAQQRTAADESGR